MKLFQCISIDFRWKQKYVIPKRQTFLNPQQEGEIGNGVSESAEVILSCILCMLSRSEPLWLVMEGGQQEKSENRDPSCVLIQAGTLNQYQVAKRGTWRKSAGQGHKYQSSLLCQIEYWGFWGDRGSLGANPPE